MILDGQSVDNDGRRDTRAGSRPQLRRLGDGGTRGGRALAVTDWEEFASFDLEFAAVETPFVVDGGRIVSWLDPITYEGLTW